MTDTAATALGGLDVDEVLDVVVRDARQPARAIHGELVGVVDELVDDFVLTLVASPQTQRTYRRACERFVTSLGQLADPADLTAAAVARHHAQLVARGLSSATVKKDRAALNSWLRWLVEMEHIPALQARQALAVKLPHAEQAQREAPKALSEQQYDDLVRAAKAAIVDDPLAGARDLAIVLVLGDAGLRCEELGALKRADVVAARKGANLRTLDVRHGKGDRGRTVKLSDRAMRAIVRWERVRVCELGEPGPGAALFVTLGRRKADGSYADVGRRCGQAVLAAVIKRLGAAAKLPAGLCHPHALRHTCATGLLRTGANIADVRTMLGHASIKTTSIYLASDEQRQEDVVTRRERGRLTLDEDRDARA